MCASVFGWGGGGGGLGEGGSSCELPRSSDVTLTASVGAETGKLFLIVALNPGVFWELNFSPGSNWNTQYYSICCTDTICV